MNKISTRLIEYDALRILAVCAVIMIHCAAGYVTAYEPNSIQFIFGNILDSSARIGVPFFVLISGTFMLDENKEYSNEKLKFKITKLFIILVMWSAFYALCYDFHNFFGAFVWGHYHLWYLYFAIGLYLTTPILRLFVKEKNIKTIYYLVLLSIIFNFIPKTLDGLFSHNDTTMRFFNLFSVGFVSNLIIYYIAGWLIKVNWSKIYKYKKVFIFTLILSLISIILFTQLRTTEKFMAYTYFYNNSNLLVFVYSISLFVLLKGFFIKHLPHNDKITKIIAELSNLTFGTYLVHASILHLTQSILKHFSTHSFVVELPVCYIGTVVLSFFVCYLISKIKYINQLIKF